MKIRNGFVSNSSSSSFAIVGAVLDEDELRKIKDFGDSDYARDVVEEEGLSYYSFDGYGAAVGLDLETIWNQMDPALKEQIVAPVKSKLEKMLGKPVEVRIEMGEYPC